MRNKYFKIRKTILIFVMLQSSSIYAYNLLHNKGMASGEISKNNTSVLLGCSDSHPPFNYFKMLQPKQHNTVEITPVNNQEEIWKDIAGYEGYYQVSNFGNIKSLSRILMIRNKHTGISKVRILSKHFDGNYYCVMLSKNTTNKLAKIHRLVANAFILNPKNKEQVNHKDGNKLNNHIENLEWCTRSENMQHAYKTGLNYAHKGVNNIRSKFKSESDIHFIRNSKLTARELSIIYNVHTSTIENIKYYRCWKHVK